MKLTPGELIDQKYRILRLLGTGGMGSVYEAENTRVDRRVAIKVMHRVRDQQDVARFEREARAAQIGSPNIVQVFDLGYLADGAPYMVMEYLAGESLGERLQRMRTLTPAELLPIARQILDALGAAHRAGIIHRDLKPDNVFLVRMESGDPDVVKILDFGISKFTDAARKAADVSLTRSGMAVGTPHFMSPEQVQGAKDLDFRSDLYSTGVIFYRCLSGQLPFQSEDVAPLLVQILMESPRPLHEVRPDIDEEMSAIIARSMARRADDRFQSAADFRVALTEWEQAHSAALRAVAPPPQARWMPSAEASKVGTNASWSSTASELTDPKRTLKNLALALLFSLVGLAGLFGAYGLWSGSKAPAAEPAAANSGLVSAAVSAASLAAATAPVVSSDSSPLLVVHSPQVPAPRTMAVAPAPPSAAAAAAAVAAAPSARLAPPNPASAPPPPPVSADDDPDNRHMSRGVH